MNKRLYKSRNDQKIDGVCAGIANYFGVDPTIIRLAWALFVVLGGCGIVAYIVCALVLPREPEYIDV